VEDPVIEEEEEEEEEEDKQLAFLYDVYK